MKESIIDEYKRVLFESIKKFGERTTVAIQVGTFYEFYGVETKDETWGNPREIGEICNIAFTRKNKEKPHSKKNANLVGVPCHSWESKYLPILVKDNNFTVVVMNQEEQRSGTKRRITKVISPGTYTDSEDNNFITCIYYDNKVSKTQEKQKEKEKLKRMIGISSVDLSTGESYIYEIYEDTIDTNYFTDELYRFLETFKSVQSVVYVNEINDNIMEQLDLNKNNTVSIKQIDKTELLLDYQEKILSGVFKEKTQMSKIVELNMERYPLASVAYTLLLSFIISYQNTLVEQLNKPIYYTKKSKCILEKNAMYQLNLIPTVEERRMYKKHSSVFNILNKTNTCMGKRLLYKRLLNPSTDKLQLTESYDGIQFYIDLPSNKFKKINDKFRCILDLEKMARNMYLNEMDINAFCNFIINLETALETVHLIDPNKSFDQIKKMIMDSKKKINITNKSINESVNETLDSCKREIKESEEVLNKVKDYLLELLKEINGTVKMEKMDKGNYYYSMTKLRYNKIKSKLSKFTIVTQTNYVKLTNTESETASDRINNLSESVKLLSQQILKDIITEYTQNYKNVIQEFINYISLQDFYLSNAKVAIDYKYTRPILLESNKKSEEESDEESDEESEEESDEEMDSEINVIGLRHPLVERLLMKLEYIPNDIKLDNDESGILLFGLNASGKTTVQKSVGLAVILAQAGLYVPAERMTYRPFKKILTRITGNDNIHKGQSTFIVEMIELNSILRRADRNTLVIGDEICHGTEANSASGIVGASIIKLSELGAKFMFATHLHNLSESKVIKDIDTLSMKHLSIKYNKDTFIYTRKIMEGPGPSTYGIEVAKTLGLPRDVIEMAESIREIESGISTKLTKKVSNYNKKKIMDKCDICKSEMGNAKVTHKNGKIVPLNTHHIKFQKDSVDNYNGHVHKNHQSNLMTVCNKCHDMIHEGEIEIKGYKMTSEGIDLEIKKR